LGPDQSSKWHAESSCGFLAAEDVRWHKSLGEEGVEEVAAGSGSLVEAGFQLVADCHQGVDLSGDTVLLCEGGSGIGYARTVDMFTRGAAPPVVRAFAISVMKAEFRTISK
jgi:hypothetical protein